jgi:two-component system cell cycle sensor histidine kinase/response regulator CckA
VNGREEGPDDWEQDERYQQLVELAPDAILVHDGERIILCNAAAARLAGATRQEQLVGAPIDTFLDPPYLKAVQLQLAESVSSAELVPVVRDTFRRLDGSEVQVEVRAIAFLDHGSPSAHLVIRDITERLAAEQAARQVEERLQQAQRMEAVGALAGGVAHEVNNMMGVILGFSDFLLRDESLPAGCIADVQEIMKAADRAAAVTRQLLAFGRRAVHRPREVDLGAVLQGAEPVLRRLLGVGRQLSLEVDGVLPVWADPAQLEQVVVNLALNARDAMPDGGTLTISALERTLSGDETECATVPPGRYTTVRVSDTGAGIDPAVQAKIFDPFFTTKPLGQGTGLGLAAAQGIMKQHNGCIVVSSAPGEGAVFTLYLPQVPAADPVEGRNVSRRVPADAAPSGLTVLVVDDEPAVCAIAARSLEEGGFRVLQAHDGGDALEIIDRHGPPDLVLTDLTMPGIGGAELARRLKQRWPQLPVLFMSGHSVDEYHLQTATQPDILLIEKPFSPGVLVATVTLALSRVRQSAPVAG